MLLHVLATEDSDIVTCTVHGRQQYCYMCCLQKIAMLLHELSTEESNIAV